MIMIIIIMIMIFRSKVVEVCRGSKSVVILRIYWIGFWGFSEDYDYDEVVEIEYKKWVWCCLFY